jgi:hypothetical protein
LARRSVPVLKPAPSLSKLWAIEPAQMAAKHSFFGNCALFVGFYQKERG